MKRKSKTACLPGLSDSDDISAFLSNLNAVTHEDFEQLELKNCELTIEHCVQIVSLFKTHPHLTSIYITHAQITDEKLAILAEGLWNLPQLSKLYLDNNNISDNGLIYLCDFIEDKPILEISFSFNALTLSSADKLSKLLSDLTSLQKLYLFSCPIGDGGVEKLAPSWRNHPSLQTISLRCTDITDKSVDVLIDVLTHNQNIANLVIDWNSRINPKNKARICELLQARKEMRVTDTIQENACSNPLKH